MKQLNYYNNKNLKQKFPISIVCDAIRTPENIGMCFRVAESFGVSKIYLHHNSPSTENRRVVKTSRNSISQVAFEFYEDFEKIISNLKKQDYTIIGIERTDKSIEIQNFNFKKHNKIVLLLGSERYGIENTSLLDYSIAIPMFGRNSSMNVIQSLAITLYETTNQLSTKK